MRGADTFTESLFSIKKLDDFVPATHPLRAIRAMVNDALSQLEDLFAGMYEDASKGGRPSIAPQKLLRAMLLQVLCMRSINLAITHNSAVSAVHGVTEISVIPCERNLPTEMDDEVCAD